MANSGKKFTAHPRVNAMLAPRLFAAALFTVILSAVPYRQALAQSAPDMGAAGGFAVLGGTAVTCTSSTIAGDAGINSGAFGACTVLGTMHEGDLIAQQAYSDFLAAYDNIWAKPCDQVLTGSLAGVTLPPGVYCFYATAALTGVLTLSGPPNGVWIFKIGTSGTGALAATNFNVVTSGGSGCYSNVYWWTAQDAPLTDSVFFGRVLAGTDMTVTRGSVKGQALAKGAMTLTNTSISLDFCKVPEVSPSYAAFPARLVMDAGSPTGFYLYFERIAGTAGYNLYEGNIGTWYSHANAAGNACNVVTDDLGTGEMRAAITPSAGNHYYLVTAFEDGQEGPSGFATPHAEIDPAQSSCSP